MVVAESSNVIASGTWVEGGTWEMVTDLPPELEGQLDLCTAVGVVALHDLPGNKNLPQVVMTRRDRGRNGQRPRWEIASGKVDPLDPADPEGAHEDLEDTGRRESLEESGVKLGSLLLFAYRVSENPSGSNYPGQSYMQYYVGFVRGQIGTPTEEGHFSKVFTLEEVGDLARTPTEVAIDEGIYTIDPDEARLVRAAYLALGYPAAKVDATLGPLETS